MADWSRTSTYVEIDEANKEVVARQRIETSLGAPVGRVTYSGRCGDLHCVEFDTTELMKAKRSNEAAALKEVHSP